MDHKLWFIKQAQWMIKNILEGDFFPWDQFTFVLRINKLRKNHAISAFSD